MAKIKKNKSYFLHFLHHTRTGFYSLVLVAIILLVGTIKVYSPAPDTRAVLGENDENRGKNESREEKSEREEKREEKKEEIRREYNIETEGLKVKYKSENGKVEREIESDDEDLDLDEDEEEDLEDKIENEFEEENETEIASDSSGITIKKNKIKARTGFPLSIDLATNQLIITRPDGITKIVTVLPDQAVANFMRHKKVNLINVPDDEPIGSGSAGTGGDDDTEVSSDSSTLSSEETQITLREREGLLVYEIKGKKKIRILGIIPVNVDTTGYVSADTGEVVDQEESFFVRILNFISI